MLEPITVKLQTFIDTNLPHRFFTDTFLLLADIRRFA